MTDKATKILLAAIAAGLWANAATSMLKPAAAQNIPTFGTPEQISARALSAIADGTCANQMLCSQLMRR